MGLNLTNERELEVKVFYENKKEILKKLNELKARKQFDGYIKQIIFDTKDHKLRDNGITLRLRKKGNKNILTLKKKEHITGVKATREIESYIEDFNKVHEIISGLGYLPSYELHKKRESYKVKWKSNDYLIEFDQFLGRYKKVPPFFEVEAKNKKLLYEFLKILGIKKQEISVMNGAQLIKRYYPNALK